MLVCIRFLVRWQGRTYKPGHQAGDAALEVRMADLEIPDGRVNALIGLSEDRKPQHHSTERQNSRHSNQELCHGSLLADEGVLEEGG